MDDGLHWWHTNRIQSNGIWSHQNVAKRDRLMSQRIPGVEKLYEKKFRATFAAS